jgi:hypothetical protein
MQQFIADVNVTQQKSLKHKIWHSYIYHVKHLNWKTRWSIDKKEIDSKLHWILIFVLLVYLSGKLFIFGSFCTIQIVILEKSWWRNYLNICTQVTSPDLHQMIQKSRKNISSPIMSKKPKWGGSVPLKHWKVWQIEDKKSEHYNTTLLVTV